MNPYINPVSIDQMFIMSASQGIHLEHTGAVADGSRLIEVDSFPPHIY